jgi:sugar lactone lactonase YvrE
MTTMMTNERRRMLAMGMAAVVLVAACGGGGGGGSDPSNPPPPPPPAAAPQLSLLAGSTGGGGNIDGPASVARLNGPSAIVVDAAGNRFVADTNNHTIRKIAPDGSVSTLAGKAGESGSSDGLGSAARFNSPEGIALDGAGGVFVADTANHTIRRIDAAGTVSTVAGAAGVRGTDNGLGSDARFRLPSALAFDGSKLFIADTTNHAIRLLDANGMVTTYAGLAGNIGDAVASTNAAAARFTEPGALALATDGALFVADVGNCVIRRIAAGLVTVVSGVNRQCASMDGNATFARLDNVSGMVVDAGGNLVIAEGAGSNVLRSVSLGAGALGQVTTFTSRGFGHLDGPLASSKFASPKGVALEPRTGNILVADFVNDLIRSVDRAAGQVATVSGQVSANGQVDGVGAAARFNNPRGLAFSQDGSVLVAQNQKVRRVQADGAVSTVALQGEIDSKAIAEAPSGLVFVSFSSTLGIVRNGRVDGVGSGVDGPPQDGDAATAKFAGVRGIAIDSQGRLVVADVFANAVRRVTQGGVVRRVAGRYSTPGSAFGDALDSALFDAPIDVAVAANDDIFVLDAGNRTVSKVTPGANGRDIVSLVAANFDDPRALAIDEAGNLYIAEGTLQQIVRIRPNGERTVIAGQAGVDGFAPGALPGALSMPQRSVEVGDSNNIVSLKVRNNRLVMTMEQAVVQISPLPQ